ncbi:MAG TPA: ATP-dependent DNA ligase [Methylomirabilota bacterium]|nr:ATP-dependent DNA ligase [Methylomirabilota bacterium]
MTFQALATYFEQLEATSSRLALIDILSNLFKSVKTGEQIEKICYLVQGRVAPFFVPLEFGMADKMIAAALATTYGEDKDEILKQYAHRGEMSLVAYELAKKHHHTGSLTVDQVFVALNTVATTSGAGSVEKKTNFFRDELLKKLDPLSVKYVVRIVLGNLRLGIGDPTILDALALAILDDRTQRKVLEGAYNRTSALGLVGKTLKDSGIAELKKLKVRVGFPIRSELCERLPTPEKVIEKMGTVDAQYKYDGFRVQLHKKGNEVRMFSRNLEDMSHMFPELIEGTRKQVKSKTAILDSEALAYQPESEEFLPFQETTKRRRKHNIEEVAKSLPLKAFVFDILYVDGKSLIDEPQSERMKILERVVSAKQNSEDILIPSVGKVLTDPKKLQFMLDDAISKGLEGVVVKKVDSPYEAGGRNFNWVKLKRHSSGELHDTIDCVILGYVYGKGKRTAFGAGALLVGVYDKQKDEFVSVTRIGTGLTDDEWRSIKERTHGLELDHKPARVNSLITPNVWVKPEIVIEVLADEITRSPMHTAGAILDGEVKEPGYALRFPRLVSFRDRDKKSEDATTVKELIEMYKNQGKK